MAQAPERQRHAEQPAQQGQARHQPHQPIPGLHHMQVLGGHQHQHRHPQRRQFGRVGTHGGEGQAALAEHVMGWAVLHQFDAAAGGGDQGQPIRLEPVTGHHGRRARPIAAGDRVGRPGVGPQLRQGHGGGQGEQQAQAGLAPGQAVGRLQQEGHAHPQLGGLGARQQRQPGPRWQRRLTPRLLGEISHQVAHHPAAPAPTGGQGVGGPGAHGGDAVAPAGPAGHPLGIGEVAIAQPGREQHRPELVAAQEHHHAATGPGAEAPRPQQQSPEAAGRRDPREQVPGGSGPVLLAGAVGAGHQHQPQLAGASGLPRRQGQAAVQTEGQRPHPGGEFAGAIAHQHHRVGLRSRAVVSRVAVSRGEQCSLGGVGRGVTLAQGGEKEKSADGET